MAVRNFADAETLLPEDIHTWKYSLSLVMTKRPNSLTSGVCCTAGWLYSNDSVKLTSLLVSKTTAAVL